MNDNDLFDVTDHPAGQIMLPRAARIGRRTTALAGLPGSYQNVFNVSTVSSMISIIHHREDDKTS
ncbi:MAG TPA: hypothetical protein VJX10_22635 [Pseudonocardiaceae bacterium]|nr:hypothetical protein [Pseudonocardiaceae bacterium]